LAPADEIIVGEGENGFRVPSSVFGRVLQELRLFPDGEQRVATADANSDSRADLIVGTGPELSLRYASSTRPVTPNWIPSSRMPALRAPSLWPVQATSVSARRYWPPASPRHLATSLCGVLRRTRAQRLQQP
jgi:hypothetical protein